MPNLIENWNLTLKIPNFFLWLIIFQHKQEYQIFISHEYSILILTVLPTPSFCHNPNLTQPECWLTSKGLSMLRSTYSRFKDCDLPILPLTFIFQFGVTSGPGFWAKNVQSSRQILLAPAGKSHYLHLTNPCNLGIVKWSTRICRPEQRGFAGRITRICHLELIGFVDWIGQILPGTAAVFRVGTSSF